MFPDQGIAYAPTLDTNISDGKWLDDWKKATIEVAKFEREHILKFGHPLWNWFSRAWKSNCRLKNSVHIHSDGNVYVCHGSSYSKCKQLKLGCLEMDTIISIVDRTYDFQQIPDACVVCGAASCAVCHVVYLPEDVESLPEAWSNTRTADKVRCAYFKWFGLVSKMLKISVMQEPRGIDVCLKRVQRETMEPCG